MAELKVKRWLHIPLFLFVLVATMVPAFHFAGKVSDFANSQCPNGTFLFGAVHSFWKDWSVIILVTELAMAIMSYLLFSFDFPEDIRSRFFPWPWPRWGIVTFAITLIVGAMGIWITHASEFCLARDAIYHRAWPWQAPQRHPWTDLTRIDVSCAHRRRSPDLDYILTMKDGNAIDIADALPAREGLVAFDRQLVGIPFSFHAEVQKSCPSYYSDWVGENP